MKKKTDLKNYKLINSINNLVGKNNIIWDYEEFKYSKFLKPLSLFLKFIKGSFYCLKYDVEVIHCRSYLPNLVGLIIKFIFKKY